MEVKKTTVEKVRELAQPIADELGFFLWDVRFEKEGATWYLRVLIDKDGGTDMDDCEAFTRPMNKALDEADPISQSYVLECGSPGLGRELRRLGNFALFLVTLVFFGAPSPAYSLAVLKNLFRPMWPGWLYRMAAKLEVPEFWLLNKTAGAMLPSAKNLILFAELLLVLAVSAVLLHGRRTAVKLAESMQLNRRNAVLAGILLIWCLCSMSGVSTYLYFKF